PAGRRVRGGPGPPCSRVHQHGWRARRDGRAAGHHHRGRGTHHQARAVGRRGAMTDAGEHAEFVLLGIPDVNGSLRGKALRPGAFDEALERGTVMTDLILGLDPVDAPIRDYERFGIRSGAADLVVHPDPDTLHELTWRPGWRVCLATPSWPDGARCDFASREVYRHVLDQMGGLGFEVMAAIEYEIRLWDAAGQPLSSGISYSLTEIGPYMTCVDPLVPALEGLGIERSAGHSESGRGLLELNLAARRARQAAGEAARGRPGAK